MDISLISETELPPEYKGLYDSLYKKISGMIGGTVIDLRNDPTTMRILLESAMIIVENFRVTPEASISTSLSPKPLSGPEKRRLAVTLTKMVITDLAKNGKIDPIVARDINLNIDFWGGIAMDIAISASKKLFDYGKEIVDDAQAKGCGASCKENCGCCIIM